MKIMKQLSPLLALIVLAACGEGEAKQIPAVKTAQVEVVLGSRDVVTIESRNVAHGVRVTGSLDPAERVELKAQVNGQLDRVNVEPGDIVKRGQVLAVIDSRTQQTQAAAARAQVTAAERDYGAAQMLYKAGAIAERDYVNAKANRDATRAQLAQVSESIARTRIVAPQNGVITEKFVSTGEAVQPGGQLFAIADITRLELQGSIPADQIANVHVGNEVALTLEAYPGRIVKGRVDRIDPVANPSTRQVAVYVVVPNESRQLVGGLFATGMIVSDSAATSASPVIPDAAVVDGHVFEVSGGRIRRVAVADVRAGESVIVTPSSSLREGASVRVAEVKQ